MSEVPLYPREKEAERPPSSAIRKSLRRSTLLPLYLEADARMVMCEDRELDGPALGEKGSKGENWLDCMRGNGDTFPREKAAERSPSSAIRKSLRRSKVLPLRSNADVRF